MGGGKLAAAAACTISSNLALRCFALPVPAILSSRQKPHLTWSALRSSHRSQLPSFRKTCLDSAGGVTKPQTLRVATGFFFSGERCQLQAAQACICIPTQLSLSPSLLNVTKSCEGVGTQLPARVMDQQQKDASPVRPPCLGPGKPDKTPCAFPEPHFIEKARVQDCEMYHYYYSIVLIARTRRDLSLAGFAGHEEIVTTILSTPSKRLKLLRDMDGRPFSTGRSRGTHNGLQGGCCCLLHRRHPQPLEDSICNIVYSQPPVFHTLLTCVRLMTGGCHQSPNVAVELTSATLLSALPPRQEKKDGSS